MKSEYNVLLNILNIIAAKGIGYHYANKGVTIKLFAFFFGNERIGNRAKCTKF